MATEPLVLEPIGPCGHKGEPACPPIECIITINGVLYVKIAGVWRVLSAVTNKTTLSALAELTATKPAQSEGK